MTHSSEYRIWNAMLGRCYNTNNSSFHNYGGRGIKVCGRWRESFENFYADMGDRPPTRSIDRIDNSGNYEPTNCRWATPIEQASNLRKNRFIEFNGKRQTESQWSRELGISKDNIRRRREAGYPPEMILSPMDFTGHRTDLLGKPEAT